jgi:serine/threonine kinase 38
VTIRDFEPLKIIGRGAYGEVRLCKWTATGELVAIKKMKKKDMIKKNEIEHIRAERAVLSKSSNKWIIDLKCSFHDEDFLYLVMEYLPGGDLMNMLIKKDIFSIEEARFYIAETILAVEYVHSLCYVHRDIKPDNILLDKDGHIKLTDFGLCTNIVGIVS